MTRLLRLKQVGKVALTLNAASLPWPPLYLPRAFLDQDTGIHRRSECSRPTRWNDGYNLMSAMMSEIVDDHIWDEGPQRRCRLVMMLE